MTTAEQHVVERFHAACRYLSIRPVLALQDIRAARFRSIDEVGRINNARHRIAEWMRRPTDGGGAVDQRDVRKYLGKGFVSSEAPAAPTHAPSYPQRRLADALDECGTTFADAFARTPAGNHLRGARGEARARVWRAMRRPDPETGAVLSFPEIAAACRMGSHTSIVEACR